MIPSSTSTVCTIQATSHHEQYISLLASTKVNLYLKKRSSPVKAMTVFKKKDSPVKVALKRTPKEIITYELQKQRQSHYIQYERQLNSLFELEYKDEIYTYMKEMEILTAPSVEMMDMQPELEWYMRPYLVDFINEVHQQFRLQPETLFLTFNIIDRYISKRVVYRKHYQLVGCTALWIAAKFEDAKDHVPTVRDLCQMCCHAYDENAFIQMEGHVLSTIGWILGHPTAPAFLRLDFKDTLIDEQRIRHVAEYLMETTLFYRDFISFTSSTIAAGALVLARNICGKRRLQNLSLDTLRCAQLINDYIAESPCEPVSQVILKKYSIVKYSRASYIVKDWYFAGGRFSTDTNKFCNNLPFPLELF